MLQNCSYLLTDFRTVFFALGPFLPMLVIFFDFNGKMAKNHFPFKSKKVTYMGRKGPRAKTKTVLKTMSKWAQFDSMQNLKFQTFAK